MNIKLEGFEEVFSKELEAKARRDVVRGEFPTSTDSAYMAAYIREQEIELGIIQPAHEQIKGAL